MAQIIKPSIPKGTRDFSPIVTSRRNYIFNTIRNVFESFGFEPIETPAMENLTTLTGKYGDEGDQLIYKVLNNADYLSKANDEALDQRDSKKLLPSISKRALRYDLTVPFARYVVQHRNDITFPFKRYQMQPVWRADKPQKGRYCEFYQCDADVIGSTSLLNEVELIQIFNAVFDQLKLKTVIKFNNRKILKGITEAIGSSDKFVAITVAIDKLSKIGVDKVKEELIRSEVPQAAINKLDQLFELQGSNASKIEFLKDFLKDSETGLKGVEELETVFKYLEIAGSSLEQLEFDVLLARGLDYYTGAIFEVIAQDVSIGSICGGGRYDNLTEIFGLKDISGVGISFGVDRIYDALEELNLFEEQTAAITKILFINFGAQELNFILPLVSQMRAAGINTEIYPEQAKMKKQMKFADAKGMQYVAIIGSEEMVKNECTLKNMHSGEQEIVGLDKLIEKIQNNG